MNHDFSKYSSIVVYGLGKSGISCLKYLLRKKIPNIYATDDNVDSILAAKRLLSDEFEDVVDKFVQSSEIQDLIDGNSKIIFAPGIPLYLPKRHKILEIIKNDKNLICDIEFFSDIFIDRQVQNRAIFNIGITGTNGKSTVSSYIDYVLDKLGLDSFLVGNVGNAIFDVANELEISKKGCLVTEVSSFQLDLMQNTVFDVAAITNITDDHLDRHGSLENYFNVKLRIFQNSTNEDYLVINYDDLLLKKAHDEHLNVKYGSRIIKTSISQELSDGVMVFDNILKVRVFGFNLTYDISNITLKGKHNQENYAIVIACLVSYLQKIGLLTKDLLDKMIDLSLFFAGVRHRMQFLGKKYGVKFVNDSKGTNPISTNFALNAYDNIFLIFGGYDKGSDFDILKDSIVKVKKVYVIGKNSDKVEKFLKKYDVKYEICSKLEIAFNKSFIDAKNSNFNDPVVMLSPACASFDQWRNFEERGDYFCKLFNEIE